MGQNIHRMHAGAKAPGPTPTVQLVVTGSMAGKTQQHQEIEKVAIAGAKAKRNPTTTAGENRNRPGNVRSQGETGYSRQYLSHSIDLICRSL